MKKVFGFIVALILGFNIHAQVCPLQEAVDFTGTDIHGNEIHLFDILDGGQAVFIHFFVASNICASLMPYVTEAFGIMGCNLHDVFFMEITHRENNIDCQRWADIHNVVYPTIGADGGGEEIEKTYGIQTGNIFILIMPDRSITIHGAQELYPFSTNDIVNALAQYGNIQPHECTGSLTVENDTVFVSNFNYHIPGRLEITNLTAEDVTINSFTADSIFELRCYYGEENVTNGGMILKTGKNAVISVFVDTQKKQETIGKMYTNTSLGDFETVVVYTTPLNIDENNEQTLTIFPNPAKDFVTVSGERLGNIIIYNALGQKVEEFFTDENKLNISTTQYPGGIYFIKTSQGKTQRFVVDK